MTLYFSMMTRRVVKYCVVLGALVMLTSTYADNERSCERCFRYCSSVSTTDACNDACYHKICEPVPENFTDWD